MKRIILLLLITMVALPALPSTHAQYDQDTLVLAFIPQENPEKLLGDIDEITSYLEDELGIEVEGFVTLDHAAAVEALRNGDADISFMGALPYVLAHEYAGAEVILSEVYRESAVYTGRIFVRKDSGIETLEDLEGKTIAFADPISESGYLFPLDLFVQAGLFDSDEDPMTYFSAVFFAGGYQQALQAVVNGFVDAAGASQYAEFLLAPDDLDDITWIAESAPIPSHAVVAREDLDPALRDAFIEAMLKLMKTTIIICCNMFTVPMVILLPPMKIMRLWKILRGSMNFCHPPMKTTKPKTRNNFSKL